MCGSSRFVRVCGAHWPGPAVVAGVENSGDNKCVGSSAATQSEATCSFGIYWGVIERVVGRSRLRRGSITSFLRLHPVLIIGTACCNKITQLLLDSGKERKWQQ